MVLKDYYWYFLSLYYEHFAKAYFASYSIFKTENESFLPCHYYSNLFILME